MVSPLAVVCVAPDLYGSPVTRGFPHGPPVEVQELGWFAEDVALARFSQMFVCILIRDASLGAPNTGLFGLRPDLQQQWIRLNLNYWNDRATSILTSLQGV